jgi:hypothetical protein
MEDQKMYEQEVEAMREHLKNLGAKLEERKARFKQEKYDKLFRRLQAIHKRLDEIDALLFTEAALTDEPDEDVLGGVTF